MDNTKLDLHDIKKMVPEETYKHIIQQAWYGDPDWLIDLISSIGQPQNKVDKRDWTIFTSYFPNNQPEDFAQELIYHQLQVQANLYNPTPKEIQQKREYEQE